MEHLLNIEVPKRFEGKRVNIFAEVRAETGNNKSGWIFEGISVFIKRGQQLSQ